MLSDVSFGRETCLLRLDSCLINRLKQGKFEWMVDPADLLVEVVDEMVQIVKQEHADNNKKPAEVGRKDAAYRGCYSVVTMELAQRGHVVS